jgi:PPOX class probable F420-dependent enzyme
VTADLSRVQELSGSETGLCVVSTTRADGTVQASVVNAGILSHPDTGAQVAAFVTRGGSVKHRHLRVRPRCTVTFRRGWEWATVEGDGELAGPDDDPGWLDAQELPSLLRAIFVAAGGTHDDWDTYDRVMRDERRLAVLIDVDRVYGPPAR